MVPRVVRPQQLWQQPQQRQQQQPPSPSRGRSAYGQHLRLHTCFLAHPVSFPFRVSPQHPLVSSLDSFPEETPWKSAGLAPNQPNRQNAGVFCRFPRFRLRFCPRPALRLKKKKSCWSSKISLSDAGKLETRELPDGAPNTL